MVILLDGSMFKYDKINILKVSKAGTHFLLTTRKFSISKLISCWG